MPKRAKAGRRCVPPPASKRIWVPSYRESNDPTVGREGTNKTDGDVTLDSSSADDHAYFANEVADEVHRFFEFLTRGVGAGGGGVPAARPGKGQWTVVAGFVALEDDDLTQEETILGPARQDKEHGVRQDPSSSSPDQDNPVIAGEPAATSTSPSRHGHRASNDKAKPSGRWKNMRICSLASGVKCLGGSVPDATSANDCPNDQTRASSTPAPETASPTAQVPQQPKWSERDSQVIDMHAEILARRELECLLGREMRTLIRRYRPPGPSPTLNVDVGNDVEEEFEPFLLEIVFPPGSTSSTDPPDATRDRGRPWFRLRLSVQLLLYTSHAPCGAASDAAHLRRLDAEDCSIQDLLSRLNIHLSSDPTSSGPSQNASAQMSAFRQSKSLDVPQICKKPSRADAPPTTAFSCSDKLGRWQWLGVQGGRLAGLFEPVMGDEVEEYRPGSRREGPIRLSGLIVGEDYEETSLRKIFGGSRVDTPDATYSRLVEGLQEVLSGEMGSHGRRWLQGLRDGEPCSIWQSTTAFAHGRAAATTESESERAPTIPPDTDIEKLRALPLPLLRDILLPPPLSAPTPFPVALSYHAFSTPQAIGPNGRLSGVTRDKKTKAWGENSVARVARGRMWDDFEGLVGEYEEVFGDLGVGGRRKGGEGWVEASAAMEAVGPYAGWHARP